MLPIEHGTVSTNVRHCVIVSSGKMVRGGESVSAEEEKREFGRNRDARC